MLYHSRGIVISYIRYSDSSIIAKIYTEKLGMLSFHVRGLFGARSRIKIALFGQLSLVDTVIDYKESRGLQYIREIRTLQSFGATDMRKTAQALFINELILRSIREQECNPELFGFLTDAVIALNDEDFFSPDFHLVFMIRLMGMMGFRPRSNYAPGHYFDMTEGMFCAAKPLHNYYLAPGLAEKLSRIIDIDCTFHDRVMASAEERRQLLDRLIDYFKINLPEFSDLRSPEVLHEVLS